MIKTRKHKSGQQSRGQGQSSQHLISSSPFGKTTSLLSLSSSAELYLVVFLPLSYDNTIYGFEGAEVQSEDLALVCKMV